MHAFCAERAFLQSDGSPNAPKATTTKTKGKHWSLYSNPHFYEIAVAAQQRVHKRGLWERGTSGRLSRPCQEGSLDYQQSTNVFSMLTGFIALNEILSCIAIFLTDYTAANKALKGKCVWVSRAGCIHLSCEYQLPESISVRTWAGYGRERELSPARRCSPPPGLRQARSPQKLPVPLPAPI